MSNLVIVDTSWLLELYRVPGYSQETRTADVFQATVESVNDGGELLVTVPVLFEVANHITHVRDGSSRRALSAKFRDDIISSIDRESPWTIVATGEDILLRAEDVIRLADRFLDASGYNHSFANFTNMCHRLALDFCPHNEFRKSDLMKRQRLYQAIAERIWSSDVQETDLA